MADVLGLIGYPSFIVVSVVLGVRLLRLALRTRKLPELAISMNFLLGAGVGYSLLIAAESLRLLPEALAGLGSFVGVSALSASGALLALFTRQVFRPASRLAAAVLAACTLWLLIGVYGSWVLHVSRASSGLGAWLGHWGPNLGLLVVYAWSSFEPLRYHVLLRRRARIGFGDPLVANRLLLWGAADAALVLIALIHLGAQLAGSYDLPPSLVGASSLLVLAIAACEWLAFFPPAAYLRRFVEA
jgi:hypothetical protein